MYAQGLVLILLNIGFNTVSAVLTQGSNITADGEFFSKSLGDLEYLEKTFKDKPRFQARQLVDGNIKVGNESELLYYSNHAAAVHCSNEGLISWDCIHCKNTEKMIVKYIVDDKSTQVRFFIGVDNLKKTIVLSIRGTANFSNFIQDANFRFALLFNDNPYIKVHRGFKQLTEKLSIQYIPMIKTLIQEHPTYDIVITGHSLGGALSTLAAIQINLLLKFPYQKIRLYTLGSSRVGNDVFAQWFNYFPITVIRAVSENDMIPHIPLRYNKYSHFVGELWIKDGKTTKCSINVIEDPNCSLSAEPFLSVKAHLRYFDKVFGQKC